MSSNTPSSHHPTLSGGTKGEELFDLFGCFVWGDVGTKKLGDELDQIQLASAPRKSWSTFIQTFDEEHKDHIKGRG
ncbi:hypothetical protein OC842_006990 [Tilletia horrida]|uniref:Uncharacterized protein n=1 Tax=Tilletia horrida TaxID=155126 RepID=A0AAN6JH42_9BASI|nr:hypothetical protein OC842_006990 [Tilletia horrida]